jgi:flagellar motility protein MotE (MotC chaperone)
MRGEEISRTKQELAAIEEEIRKAYARWLELEAL